MSRSRPNRWAVLAPPPAHDAPLPCAHHLRGRTNTHSDFTGGVAPHPTLADPRRASAPAVVRQNNPRTTKVPREPRRTRIPTPPVESRRASPRPPAPSGPETSTSVFV